MAGACVVGGQESKLSTQVANISLGTQDVGPNRRFYVEFLELEVREDDGKMLVLEGNLLIDGGHPNPTTTWAHIMLLSDDLDALEKRAAEFGYACKKHQWGSLGFSDPDGRMVEVMRESAWRELQTKRGVKKPWP